MLHSPGYVYCVLDESSTWKSLNTTRPHWFAVETPSGVLNVRCIGAFCVGRLIVIQFCVGAVGLLKSRRSASVEICPSVDDAPIAGSFSHCASSAPFAKF